MAEEKETLFDDAPPLKEKPKADEGFAEEITSDLTVEQKAELARLLNKGLPVAVRAQQLCKLAMYTDTKRAPVALRAIQTINAITGITEEADPEASPMFMLPEGAKVETDTKEPKK